MNDGGWRKSLLSTTNGCVEVHMHWRKSSRSGGSGCVEVAFAKSSRSGTSNCVEVGVARTSSHSGQLHDCVEVEGLAEGGVAVRDSKDRDGPVLRFTPISWGVLLDAVRHDEFDWRIFSPLGFNTEERGAFLAGVRDGEFDLAQ
jgi:hypothetical protein